MPAGNTPIPLYRAWEKHRPPFLESLRFIQIDDLLNGKKKGLFKKFFEAQLPSHAARFEWIENSAPQQADLAVLGLGLNGHVAFHEPGLPADFQFGEVELSESTKTALGLEAKAKGITYGAQAFFNAKAILILVTGASKKDILARLRARTEPDPKLPISLLLDHPDLTFLVDEPAMPID